MSLGSQMDLQRKKRRAPAPPPPSPLVPARTEDREENRKSAMGAGRQVPQKPPRGSTRGPPQLVLPPPPPYPPPDMDVAEPLGFPGDGAAPEASDLRPTRSPPLGPGPVEAEETVSVSSCFASEDTTEDSGVVSSPSDIVSLDSQHDSAKSRDKWATDPEDGSDQDLVGTPEPGPPKSPTWDRSGPGRWPCRPEEAAPAPEDGEDLLMAGRLAQTLADLDEDLEGLDDSYSYETDSSSVTGSVGGLSGGCGQGALPEGDPEAIPVTFIGDVLDDPLEPASLSNSNNNAGSCDRGSAARSWAPLPPASQGEPPPHGGQGARGPDTPAPPQDAGREARAASSTCKDVHPIRTDPKAASEPPRHQRGPEEPAPGKEGADPKAVTAPPSWYQRGQNPGGSFGLKYGLTTYKIVPPKSERRCYDPGVSLSTGAIKIDELGNLVSPPAGGRRAVAPSASALPRESQPLRSAREPQRPGNVEKLPGPPPSPTPTTPTTAQPQAEPSFQGPAGTSPQSLAAQQAERRPPGQGRSRQPSAASSQAGVPAASSPQRLFLKPQWRTSSQYVASAIARRIGPARAHDGAGEAWEGRAPALRGRPGATKVDTARSPCPEPHACGEEATSPCGHLPDNPGEEPAVGARPWGQVDGPPRKLPPQDGPGGAHRGRHVPLVTAARRDHEPVGPGWGLGAKQSPSPHSTGSVLDPRRRPDGTQSPPSRPGDAGAPGRSLVNGSGWAPGSDGQASAEQEGTPHVLCTDIHDADGSPPPSIFGPKKKFRPVVQRPAPKDTCLHSALMEAIQAAGGRDRLRKTPEPSPEGGPKKLSYVEPESEHSALLAAIRGHRGACSLRKVASCASEELRSFREAARSAHGAGLPGLEYRSSQPPPSPPAPAPAAPTPAASRTAPRLSANPLGDPVDARQALMDAIRSGTGAARLRKVPLLV